MESHPSSRGSASCATSLDWGGGRGGFSLEEEAEAKISRQLVQLNDLLYAEGKQLKVLRQRFDEEYQRQLARTANRYRRKAVNYLRESDEWQEAFPFFAVKGVATQAQHDQDKMPFKKHPNIHRDQKSSESLCCRGVPAAAAAGGGGGAGTMPSSPSHPMKKRMPNARISSGQLSPSSSSSSSSSPVDYYGCGDVLNISYDRIDIDHRGLEVRGTALQIEPTSHTEEEVFARHGVIEEMISADSLCRTAAQTPKIIGNKFHPITPEKVYWHQIHTNLFENLWVEMINNIEALMLEDENQKRTKREREGGKEEAGGGTKQMPSTTTKYQQQAGLKPSLSSSSLVSSCTTPTTVYSDEEVPPVTHRDRRWLQERQQQQQQRVNTDDDVDDRDVLLHPSLSSSCIPSNVAPVTTTLLAAASTDLIEKKKNKAILMRNNKQWVYSGDSRDGVHHIKGSTNAVTTFTNTTISTKPAKSTSPVVELIIVVVIHHLTPQKIRRRGRERSKARALSMVSSNYIFDSWSLTRSTKLSRIPVHRLRLRRHQHAQQQQQHQSSSCSSLLLPRIRGHSFGLTRKNNLHSSSIDGSGNGVGAGRRFSHKITSSPQRKQQQKHHPSSQQQRQSQLAGKNRREIERANLFPSLSSQPFLGQEK
eukprot:jgi/Bigna1/136988/aug1.37_g11696